jgi:hemoglobin
MRNLMYSFTIATVTAIALVSTTAALTALAGQERAATAAAAASADAAPATPDQQIQSLEAMCAANADDRAARHAETTLYERLGKEEGIHALTKEVVRLHMENDQIKHMVDESYADELANRVALFMISGMGGPPVYEGPSLTESHEHLELTNADFLAAGGDVIQAMKNLDHGQDEIDEVVCALVGLRDQVVLTDQASAEW